MEEKIEFLSLIPNAFDKPVMCGINNTLHIFNNSSNGSHYIYNIDTKEITSLSKGFAKNVCEAIVFENKIHIFTRYINIDKEFISYHYIYNVSNNTWEKGIDIPVYFDYIKAIIINNRLNLFIIRKNIMHHYELYNNTWTEINIYEHSNIINRIEIAKYKQELYVILYENSKNTKIIKYENLSFTITHEYDSDKILVYSNDSNMYLIQYNNNNEICRYLYNGSEFIFKEKLCNYKSQILNNGKYVIVNNVLYITGFIIGLCINNGLYKII